MEEDIQVKIGLETHVQLDTRTKLLCACPNEKADKPNTKVCPTCLGHPGSKPQLNQKVLEQAVKTSEALQLDIEEEVYFSRKTYFYPDMSKNYQTTQYEVPVGRDGQLEIQVEDEKKPIRIQRLHIEEDPAKLKHKGGSISNAKYTLVDYNRAGTPLLEIVTKPDFKSPKEARSYLQELAKILEYLGIYDSDSDFSIKSDANISIEGGERVEVKNITGTKGIEQALKYEITRQKQLKKRGREVEQETRSYNADQEITEKLRDKETEEDYGYIFEPDLTTQNITEKQKKELKEEIPELPHEKFERFLDEYNLEPKIVEALITERKMAKDYEELVQKHEKELTASFMTGDLRKVLNYNEISYEESSIQKQWISYILDLLEQDKISDRNAELLTREIAENPKHPEKVVKEQDLLKAEEDEVKQFVEQVIDDNPEAVEDYREGKDDAINFLVGQVMQKSQGKADPKNTREEIVEQITEQ